MYSKISHGTLLLILAAIAILSFLSLSFFFSDLSGVSNRSLAVLGSFFLNGAIGTCFLVKSIVNRPFSLVQMHWMFYVTMFVVAPLSQYLYGYSVWGYCLYDDDYLRTNIILTCWGLLFAWFSGRAALSRNGASSFFSAQDGFYSSLPAVTTRAVCIALLLSFIATVTVVAMVGFSNLFSRSDYSTGLNKTSMLIFNNAIRPIPAFSLVVAIVQVKQQKKMTLNVVIAFLLTLISNFPAAMPRYSMACLYGGIALLAIRPLFDRKGLFSALFLVAFLIVFPAANAYRFESFDITMFLDAIAQAAGNLPMGFCAVDYDAYSIVARTIQYVGEWGSTFGYQLLGVLLFFVPRSIWPSKPEGSGNLVAAAQGQQQLNISSPLPAEGIINFGVVGLILFAIVLAAACRKADKWTMRSKSILRLFYPFLCMYLFFLMRGDLLSGTAFLVGRMVSFVLVVGLSMAGASSQKDNRWGRLSGIGSPRERGKVRVSDNLSA